MWWAKGSRTGRTGAAGGSKGCWDAITALGEWSSLKTSLQGVTWNVGADTAGVSEIATCCGGGLTAVLGDHVGLVLSGPPLETHASSPLEVKELGSGLDVGMGEQACTMTQRFPEEK